MTALKNRLCVIFQKESMVSGINRSYLAFLFY